MTRMRSSFRPSRKLRFGFVLGACLSGCSNSHERPDAALAGGVGGTSGGGQAGQANAPACNEQLELRLGEFLEEDQPLALLEAGDALHLWGAPQGGFVVTVAAEVRGLVTSIVDISARLLDLETEALVSDNLRTIVMTPIAGQPGWMSPDIRSRSQVAHIALCPGSERVVRDQEFVLEIEIRETESDCRGVGVRRVPVVPRCLQEVTGERAYCDCQCGPPTDELCRR